MGFLLAQWTGWNWRKFKCFRCPKFSPCHCKSKLFTHVRLSTKMPTLNIFELRQRFRKSVEYFWRYRTLLAQCTGWKRLNFKCCRRANFSPCHCKSKISAHRKLSTLMPTLKIFRAEAKISKIYWIPLEIWDFCWHSEQVERGKNSNFFHPQSFHLAIAKVNYPRTWDFPSKCPPSTSTSWGKDFENWLNTFGDIGFLQPQCTVYRLKAAKIQMLSMPKVFTLPLQK